MPFYKWSESMSVGMPEIDSDRKALIRLINQLHNNLHTKSATVLSEILDSLIACVEFQFAREERVMEAGGYPGTEPHKEEHVSFTNDVYEMRDCCTPSAEAAVIRELLDFLKIWLNHHVLIQDVAYKPFIKGCPKARAAARAFGPGLADDDLDTVLGPITGGASLADAI